MQTAKDFIETLSQNDTLANGLIAEIGDREGQSAYEAVSRFARENGYSVSIDEARQAHAAYQDAAGNGDISDDALEGVSGGSFDPQGAQWIADVMKEIFKGW